MEGFSKDVTHNVGGCVARKAISRGTSILVESPAFKIPIDSNSSTIEVHMRRLRPQEISYIGSLRTNGHPILPQNQNVNATVPSEALVAIFSRYNLRCGTQPRLGRDVAQWALFLDACKLKRSCQPNLHGHWVDGKMHFRTMRDIAKGEELLLSSDVQGILFSREERHERLRARHGFECSCASLNNVEQVESNRRRQFIKGVMDQIHSNAPINGGLVTIQCALDYMEQEGILHFRDTLCFARFRAYEDQPIRDTRVLVHYLEETRDWIKTTVGTDDPRYKDVSDTLEAIFQQ